MKIFVVFDPAGGGAPGITGYVQAENAEGAIRALGAKRVDVPPEKNRGREFANIALPGGNRRMLIEAPELGDGAATMNA